MTEADANAEIAIRNASVHLETASDAIMAALMARLNVVNDPDSLALLLAYQRTRGALDAVGWAAGQKRGDHQ